MSTYFREQTNGGSVFADFVASAPVIHSVNNGQPIPNLGAYTTVGDQLTGTTFSVINSKFQGSYNVVNDEQVTQSATRPDDLAYGVAATYAIDNATAIITMAPPAGSAYVNLTSIASGGLIEAIPALKVGDQVAWTTQGGNITVQSNGTVLADTLPAVFQVEVFDGTEWGVFGTITLEEAADVPPVLETPIPDQALLIGSPVSLDITGNFSDADSYTASPLPSGVSFTDGVFSGTVDTGGSTLTTVTASNAFGGTPDNFLWTVATTLPPEIDSPIPDQEYKVGEEVELDITTNFSNATSYTASPLPGGLVFTNGLFSGVLTTQQNVTTVVTASNSGGSTPDTFSWTINPEAVPVRKKFVFKMDEGSGDVITNSDPDTGAAFNGSWSNTTGWTNFPANSRFYPINEGSGDIIKDTLWSSDLPLYQTYANMGDGNRYGVLEQPIVLEGDFEIEWDNIADTSGGVVVIGDTENNHLRYRLDLNRFDIVIGGGTNQIFSGIGLADGQHHRSRFTRIAGRARFYVDGVQIDTDNSNIFPWRFSLIGTSTTADASARLRAGKAYQNLIIKDLDKGLTWNYPLDEGSGTDIINSDPSTPGYNGAWTPDTDWQYIPAPTDGTIENYTDNWTEE